MSYHTVDLSDFDINNVSISSDQNQITTVVSYVNFEYEVNGIKAPLRLKCNVFEENGEKHKFSMYGAMVNQEYDSKSFAANNEQNNPVMLKFFEISEQLENLIWRKRAYDSLVVELRRKNLGRQRSSDKDNSLTEGEISFSEEEYNNEITLLKNMQAAGLKDYYNKQPKGTKGTNGKQGMPENQYIKETIKNGRSPGVKTIWIKHWSGKCQATKDSNGNIKEPERVFDRTNYYYRTKNGKYECLKTPPGNPPRQIYGIPTFDVRVYIIGGVYILSYKLRSFIVSTLKNAIGIDPNDMRSLEDDGDFVDDDTLNAIISTKTDSPPVATTEATTASDPPVLTSLRQKSTMKHSIVESDDSSRIEDEDVPEELPAQINIRSTALGDISKRSRKT